MCAHSKLKTRSKNIEVVMSNGRVTDTSSAETNLASHRKLRLAPAARCRSFSLLLPERESSGMSAEAVVQDDGAVRIVALATSEAFTSDREDACSFSAVGDNGAKCLPATVEMLL